MRVDRLSKVFLGRTKLGSDGGPPCPVRIWDRRSYAGLLLFGLAFATGFGCLAQDGDPIPQQTPVSSATEVKPQAETDAKSAKLQKAEAADSARKKAISDESTQLLAMALSLKAEVDKTSKDTLSLNVIRKADEIERLAKTVKEKIKQGSGAS